MTHSNARNDNGLFTHFKLILSAELLNDLAGFSVNALVPANEREVNIVSFENILEILFW